MDFLVDENLMIKVARAFPEVILNIGYPEICSQERVMCERIIESLSMERVESAVVGHALPNHLETMASLVNKAENTSANFWIPFSDYMIYQTMKKRPKQVLEHAKKMAGLWKDLSSRPLDVALVDSTANEPNSVERLMQFYEGLKSEGVRSVIICDTKGKTTPKKLTDLLVGFRGTSPDLEYHPHNDNGLALQNIEAAVQLGVTGIGTGIFGHGERGTMVDPRLLVAKYGIQYKPLAFRQFRQNYDQMIQDLGEIGEIFKEGVVVTGTQYRLRGRDPSLIAKFGVTSDKYILGKLTCVDPNEISDEAMEKIKNDLYLERKRVFQETELKTKLRGYNGNH
jgi:hypothetical protein